MVELAVFIPTYKRPKTLQNVADNIKITTHNPYTLYFGCEPDDRESIMAAADTGATVIINKGNEGYSDTVQTLYERTTEPYFFVGNDDFFFLKDWDVEPLRIFEVSPYLMVVGMQDGNPGSSGSTIHMIRREYIKESSGVIDIPNRVFYPYNHNYQDTEFTETAQARRVWGRSTADAIEHHHPDMAYLFGEVERDETYLKNAKHVYTDSNTYHDRKHLWQNL